jgi:glycosyltransferase involved in cell wall biosynthesis
MKILRVVSSGYCEGGAEVGIVDIGPYLKKRGHEIKILSGDARPDLPHFNDYTFRSPQGLFQKLLYTFNVHAFFALKRAIRDFKPDVVHLHTLGAASPLILFALSGYPTVATVHGPEGYTRDLIIWNLPKTDFKGYDGSFSSLRLVGKLRYIYYRFINYPIYRVGFRYVDEIVTISTYISTLMKNQGMDSTYIPNGIKMFECAPLVDPADLHTIVFSGRLEKFKGVEFLLRALPAVVEKFPDTKLLILGNGRDKADLEAVSAELGLTQHVTFLGHVSSREEIQDIYSKAGVMVVPSVWPEVSSRFGIESLSAGRPVIGSEVGGLTDWLKQDKTGYLVPPGDAEAITKALLDLFSQPEKHFAMAAQAREMAERYDMSLHAEKIETVYKRIIQTRKLSNKK